MKKRLLKFLTHNCGRLLLLAMILFIGQGVGFSQGIKTVTSGADDGDGSLRQTIEEAVDGDIIIFNGQVRTITLDTTLTLGDKTITIDGGGDIILERDIIALDSFRVVDIAPDSAKVVSIKNLTIQNGLLKDLGGVPDDETGAGIRAQNNDYGQVHLEGLVFKNNVSDGAGGGAIVSGGTDTLLSKVINCEFIENEAGGDDGGGLWANYTEISGCTFTDNIAGDDGGGAWVAGGVTIDNSVFTGNSCGDVGGAMRIQDRGVVVSNSVFDSNSSINSGGAVMLARGTMINCEFISNSTLGQGGAINGNQNECYFYGCVFTGNSAIEDGGAVWMDDGGTLENSILTNNVAGGNGGGIYLAGKKQPASLVGCIVANNTADSIGGGVFAATGDIVNSTITGNYAAENGGAIAGDGTWTLANSIVYDNDAAGADKNIQVVSNLATIAAQNSAVDANGYDPAAWTASGITTLTESPFVGGSEADSLMLPAGSALIDAGDITGLSELYPGGWDHIEVLANDLNGVKRVINGAVDLGAYEKYVTLVVENADDSGAGSLRQVIVDAVDGDNVITFADGITNIKVNQPLELGDKSVMIDGGGAVVLDGAFNGDPLLDIYRVFNITGVMDKTVTIKNLTVQNGIASDNGAGGGLLADHSAGGQTMLDNLVFKDNKADDMGGAVSISGYNADTVCMITNTEFIDNTSVDDGGAMVSEYTTISESTFSGNQTGDNGGAARANTETMFKNCTFTGNVASGSAGAIRLSAESASIYNSVFDANEASGGSGAVFMARGSIYNSEFTNNIAGGSGGAIFANQNECYIHDCVFTGNSGADGGALYFDDGGSLINSYVANNSATANGGGVFLEGNKAPASIIGCIIDNNTADGQGGGVYTQVGDVINTIIKDNYAGTNGGAFTGDGEWFLANLVVWNNDAAGAQKNIEVVANSATDHATNCAIDATAYDETAWTAANITTLDASPFMGGTEADSLYFPQGSALIDGGTMDSDILAVLPEMDIDGNMRIQSAVDIGAYESENIFVESVMLDKTSIELIPDETETIVATVVPEYADNPAVTWTSSDDNVATVDGGVVTAVAAGSVTITATTEDGGLTATCDVLVAVPATGIELDQTSVDIDIAETVTLVATVLPEDATNQLVGWSSSDEGVATVVEGVVTGVSAGTATITVTALDGFWTATCEVTVNEIAVTGVSLDQSTLAMAPEETATLVATVTPDDAGDNSVSWSSSDDAVATVADGVVTAVADGTCTITVTTTDGGFTATCEVTVETVGIANFENSFRVYPNPVQDNLMIEGQNIQSVAVYTVTGAPVMLIEEGISKGINVSAIDAGMYLLKITSDKGTAVSTIVKE
ncbi:MAG TPA: Ig-like domain-containing protein [Bacteroidales bacterium]|nr:Ig-like domain-containing protein [Bacteroidales bacterium]